MDYSLPGSSVHGIFQVRVLEWVAISFSRESSRPRDRTWVSRIAHALLSEPPGKPNLETKGSVSFSCHFIELVEYVFHYIYNASFEGSGFKQNVSTPNSCFVPI